MNRVHLRFIRAKASKALLANEKYSLLSLNADVPVSHDLDYQQKNGQVYLLADTHTHSYTLPRYLDKERNEPLRRTA